uniref:Uncharacterized protein n=1 Tax=Rhizophora mucronata TaxID=61149 RepID=A0A2P2R1M9_RHIMU
MDHCFHTPSILIFHIVICCWRYEHYLLLLNYDMLRRMEQAAFNYKSLEISLKLFQNTLSSLAIGFQFC